MAISSRGDSCKPSNIICTISPPLAFPPLARYGNTTTGVTLYDKDVDDDDDDWVAWFLVPLLVADVVSSNSLVPLIKETKMGDKVRTCIKSMTASRQNAKTIIVRVVILVDVVLLLGLLPSTTRRFSLRSLPLLMLFMVANEERCQREEDSAATSTVDLNMDDNKRKYATSW